MVIQKQVDLAGCELGDRFVSREQAATYLGLSVATLACWASAGWGPRFAKLSAGKSGCVRYSLVELRKFIADPQSYGPRPKATFRKPVAIQRDGQPRLNVRKARRRRGKGEHGS